MSSLPRDRILLLIVIAGVLLRLLWSFWAQIEPISDFAAYLRMAENVLDGKGWKGRQLSAISPGYPALLVAVFKVHRSIAAVWIANAALGGFAIYMTFALCQRMRTSLAAARIGSGISAFYPDLVVYSGTIASENLAIPLSLVVVWLVCVGYDIRRKHIWFLTGLTLGLLCLTRGMMLVWVPVIAVWMCWEAREHRPGSVVLPVLALVVGVILVLSPWTARNWRIHRAFVPVTTELGLGLLGGNNAVANGEWMRDYLRVYPVPDGLDEVEKSRYMTAEAFAYVRSNPISAVELAVKKAALFWGIKMDGVYKHQTRIGPAVSLAISTAGQSAIVVLFVVGLFLTYPWSVNQKAALTATASLFLITVVFYYLTRYRVVLYPIWAPIASIALLHIREVLRGRESMPRYLPQALSLLAVIWIWVIWRSADQILTFLV